MRNVAAGLRPTHSHVRFEACERCFFRYEGTAACAAFPSGIPAPIAAGHVEHTRPYRGDGGIWFLPSREIHALARAQRHHLPLA